jgi:hypothetical protein
MISALNRPQLLSGSKLVFFLILILSLSACDLFRKLPVEEGEKAEDKETLDDLQGKKVYDPVTGTYIYVPDNILTAKMDTVRWKDTPLNPDQIITSEGAFVEVGDRISVLGENEIGSKFLSAYNVSIILPFMSQDFDPNSVDVNRRSLMALNYYSGVRMALDELDSEGIKLNVRTFDSEASQSIVSNLLRSNPDVQDAHLIIGPFQRDNVRMVAENVRGTGQVFVSPWNASSSLSGANPNYVQVSPTLKTHCEAIIRHARQKYRPDQVVLIARDRRAERESLGYFQDENFRIMGDRNPENQLNEYIISNDEDFDQIDVLPLLELQDTTVFIIPSWQETFVYSLLRKIELARDEYAHVVVYGMPQWAGFELIDFEYYEKLNVHISSNTYIDPVQTDVKFFRSRFFERFGAPPTNEAFIGYDVMLYMGRMLKKHGTKFQYALDRERAQYLHTRFDINQVVTPTTTGAERLPIEQFENKYVNILKFQDYYFQRAN